MEGILKYEHSPESYGTAPTALLFTMLNKVVLTFECAGRIHKRFYFELGDICRRMYGPSNLHRERSANGHHDSLPIMIHSHKKWHLIYLQRRMFKLQCTRFTITYGICHSRQVRNIVRENKLIFWVEIGRPRLPNLRFSPQPFLKFLTYQCFFSEHTNESFLKR